MILLKERLAVYRNCMNRPYVTGKDLISAGLTPENDFTDILAYAHKLRLAGIEKENALKQVLAYARNLRKKTAAMNKASIGSRWTLLLSKDKAKTAPDRAAFTKKDGGDIVTTPNPIH